MPCLCFSSLGYVINWLEYVLPDWVMFKTDLFMFPLDLVTLLNDLLIFYMNGLRLKTNYISIWMDNIKKCLVLFQLEDVTFVNNLVWFHPVGLTTVLYLMTFNFNDFFLKIGYKIIKTRLNCFHPHY